MQEIERKFVCCLDTVLPVIKNASAQCIVQCYVPDDNDVIMTVSQSQSIAKLIIKVGSDTFIQDLSTDMAQGLIKEFSGLHLNPFMLDSVRLNWTAPKVARVRYSTGRYLLTFKGPQIGLTRPEIEFEIMDSCAKALIKKGTDEIVKNRFSVEYAGHIWEIDVFEGKNKGLVLAEVELNSESDSVLLPSWVDQEVSTDLKYTNAYLGKNPYTSW